jgi:SAM-dependent methyltransferase
VSAAPAGDLLATAMVDFAAGRRAPFWLRVAPGRRLTHDLAAYFAPVTAYERALLDLVEGPVLDVGCGPARHARLLQARGLTAIGLDRSLVVLGLARSLGLRHWFHGDALSGPLPAVRSALLLDGNLGMAGTPAGAARLLDRLAAACGPGGRLLVDGRAPRRGWLRSLVVRDEYQNQVGPWGRWLQAGLAAVLDLAAPAGWRLRHAGTAGARYWAAFSLDPSFSGAASRWAACGSPPTASGYPTGATVPFAVIAEASTTRGPFGLGVTSDRGRRA